jgi:hypothetical protein
MKQSNDEIVFDKDAFVARLMAIATRPKVKPVPTAGEGRASIQANARSSGQVQRPGKPTRPRPHQRGA